MVFGRRSQEPGAKRIESASHFNGSTKAKKSNAELLMVQVEHERARRSREIEETPRTATRLKSERRAIRVSSPKTLRPTVSSNLLTVSIRVTRVSVLLVTRFKSVNS